MAIFTPSYGGLKYTGTTGGWSVSWGFIMIIVAMLLSFAAAALNVFSFVSSKDTA